MKYKPQLDETCWLLLSNNPPIKVKIDKYALHAKYPEMKLVYYTCPKLGNKLEWSVLDSCVFLPFSEKAEDTKYIYESWYIVDGCYDDESHHDISWHWTPEEAFEAIEQYVDGYVKVIKL